MNKTKYAIAFVHLPTGQMGHSVFIYDTRQDATSVCKELDIICSTIKHFALMEGENLNEEAKKIKDKYVGK